MAETPGRAGDLQREAGALSWEPGELPVYTVSDVRPRLPGMPAAPTKEPGTLGRAARAVATWVEDAIDGDGISFAAPATLETRSPQDNLLVVHRFLGDADGLAEGFLRLVARTNGRLRSPLGTLRATPATPTQASQLVLLRGQLRLHTSFVPIPVELEVERWGSVGVVVFLRPVRHLVTHIGWHRRWAWFLVGHGVLEQVRRALERPAAAS